jgi:dienelactone hydrolase
MKAISKLLLVASLLVASFISCDKGDDEEVVTVYLEGFTEYTSSKSLAAADVKGYLEQYGQSELAALASYDIKIYRLEYKTAFEGDTIIASGLIAVPKSSNKKDEFPILSYQHALLLSNNDAPSVNQQANVTALATYIASTGFIVIMPDYIGYGSADMYGHPFMHKESTANSVIDFIRASKEFIATEKPCKTNGNIFLSGFGEGASATLSALSAIENDAILNYDLKVRASTCSSGMYNLIRFREWLLTQPKFDQPWYLAYLLESFSRYAELEIDYSLVFNEPFASLVHGLVNGTRTYEQMNDLFGTKSLEELLNAKFKNNETFNTDTVYAGLKEVFTKNSIPAWKLNSSVSFYYGKSDNWIPADQSLAIFNDFRDVGGTTTIKIVALDGLDHETAVIPALVNSVNWFRAF